MKPAPIILFTYKRLDTLRRTVEALSANKLASESILYIFSDAAKKAEDEGVIQQVRNYLRTIDGFRSVIIEEAPVNKGLANSIIDGVSKVIAEHGKVIVLEDDLVTSRNFLLYQNQALNFYQNQPAVFSIAGFSIPIRKSATTSDVYFTYRSNSTGWATWYDRWEKIDWKVPDYDSFSKDFKQRRAFNRMGSDMYGMLSRQMKGEINSWAIRWCYHQFRNSLYSVHPIVSKVQNIGFDSPDATHTKEKFNRFETIIDNGEQNNFHFPIHPKLEARIIKQFVRPFSIVSRTKYKLLNAFYSFISSKKAAKK